MLNFLFNPCGRVSRGGFWIGLVLPQLGLSVLAAFVDAMTAPAIAAASSPADLVLAPPGLASSLVSLFFLWPNIAVPVKRFHDRGMSGWWVLWFGLATVACIVFALVSLVGAGGGLQAVYEAAQAGVEPALDPNVGADAGMAMIAVFGAIGVGLAQFVILYLLPGQPGGNRFGPDPRDGGGRVEQTAVSSDWAERLDRDKLNAAAAASRKAAAPKAAERGPRQVSWPTGAGPRASFGRRGA